jgi:hypothetical protein
MRIATDGLGRPRETFTRVLHFQILLPPSAALPLTMEGSRGLLLGLRRYMYDHMHVLMVHSCLRPCM